MDFIFMLTKHDRTVEDCLEVLEAVRPLGLKHLGFKDIGVDKPVLREMVQRIRDQGAQTYLEVVSTSREAALASARTGVEIGVDHLLGGTHVDAIMAATAGSSTRCYPFPGLPAGHPTRLGGSPALVESQCRAMMAQGCGGVDLLAYRATEADPLELIRAARRGLGEGLLIVAGSIDSAERIRAVAEAGADAFTIGTAVLCGAYAPAKALLRSQLQAVLADCEAAGLPAAAG
jgi:hypothetical protein